MCIIITRTFNPNRIVTIKQNLKNVLQKHDVQYVHYLVVDLTRGATKEQFLQFEDQRTKCFFIQKKKEKDKYCSWNIDQLISQVKEQGYIYMLDDDNLLAENFYQLNKFNSKEAPVLVFNVHFKKPTSTYRGVVSPIAKGQAIGRIDISNYMVDIELYKKLKFGTDLNSQQSDGIFFNKLLQSGVEVKYLNEFYGNYNALK